MWCHKKVKNCLKINRQFKCSLYLQPCELDHAEKFSDVIIGSCLFKAIPNTLFNCKGSLFPLLLDFSPLFSFLHKINTFGVEAHILPHMIKE